MQNDLFGQTDIQRRVAELERHNQLYRSGQPAIDDERYDRLVEELRELDPDNAFLNQVEPEDLGGEKIRHDRPMLSTEKAYTREQLQRWVDRVEKAGVELGLKGLEYRVTPKLDGLAGRDEGGVFATRGNGRVGSNITYAFERGVKPIGGRDLGLGEIVIQRSWFLDHAAEDFDHPRNMCVGIITADNVSEVAQLALDAGVVHFVPYVRLPEWRGSGAELVERATEITDDLREQADYALDGMVAEATDAQLREYMGATSHHYRWQIALKERGERVQTSIEDIAWQTGRTGNVTPVLLVTPVKVSGATISRVTGHHAGMVRDLKLGRGARIEIIRSGEVIPKLEEVLEQAAEVVLAESCPSCGSELRWVKDFLNCPNDTGCPAQVETSIRHFFRTLGTADNFGPKTIARLVAGGFDSLEKVYALTEEALLGLDFGPGQSANLLAALANSKTESVEDARFLAAIGIKDLGVGDSRKLLAAFPLESLQGLTEERLAEVKGFGAITSRNIVRGLAANWSTIAHLLAMDFSLVRTPLAGEEPEISSPVSGKRVLFTGKMLRGSREDMQVRAKALGAVVASGISGKLDLLVTGEKPSAGKVAKAEKLGVQVLSEEAWYELIDG